MDLRYQIDAIASGNKVWSKSVGDGEDKEDKEDKGESSCQLIIGDHTPSSILKVQSPLGVVLYLLKQTNPELN
jgi:hypothetical protein